MPAQAEWDIRFLRLAREVASWSKDPSTKVGAVLVADRNRILSVGYNGFPRQNPDSAENLTNRSSKYARMVHAEENALLFRPPHYSAGLTIYTWPFSSCAHCTAVCLQCGVCRFVSLPPTDEPLKRWGANLEEAKRIATEGYARVEWLSSTLLDR